MTVRLRHSTALARMLLLFFRRRVLRVGVLQSGLVRLMAALGVASLFVLCSGAAYFFLRPMVSDRSVWHLLFDTATVSLLLWTQIAFVFIKVLFLNAEGLLELSFQLPLTNRERATAFLLYEASMTGALAAAGSFSLAFAALALLGPAALPRLIESIILPVVVAYLVLSVLYLCLKRLCRLLRLRSVENVLVVLAMFALLVLYSTQMPALVSRVGRAYLDERSAFVWVTWISWLSRHQGFGVALAAGIVAAALLLALALALMPQQHVRHAPYLDVPVGRVLRRHLGPYDWCLLRNAQTTMGAAVALALFGYLCVEPLVSPVWALSVLSLGGLYQFAATEPLRVLTATRASAWRIYTLLLRAQLVLLGLFAVPALVMVRLLTDVSSGQSFVALLGCVVAALLMVCIGVMFPAEKDNPLSVFIGLSMAAVVGALCAIALGILQLPSAAVVVFVVASAALSVWYAVYGIRVSELRRRNEEGTAGRELRRRRGAADLGDGSRRAALSDVLDG